MIRPISLSKSRTHTALEMQIRANFIKKSFSQKNKPILFFSLVVYSTILKILLKMHQKNEILDCHEILIVYGREDKRKNFGK